MDILADSGKTWKVKSGPDGIVMKPQNPLLAGISASSEAMDNVLDNGVFIIPLKSLSDQRFENTPSSH